MSDVSILTYSAATVEPAEPFPRAASPASVGSSPTDRIRCAPHRARGQRHGHGPGERGAPRPSGPFDRGFSRVDNALGQRGTCRRDQRHAVDPSHRSEPLHLAHDHDPRRGRRGARGPRGRGLGGNPSLLLPLVAERDGPGARPLQFLDGLDRGTGGPVVLRLGPGRGREARAFRPARGPRLPRPQRSVDERSAAARGGSPGELLPPGPERHGRPCLFLVARWDLDWEHGELHGPLPRPILRRDPCSVGGRQGPGLAGRERPSPGHADHPATSGRGPQLLYPPTDGRPAGGSRGRGLGRGRPSPVRVDLERNGDRRERLHLRVPRGALGLLHLPGHGDGHPGSPGPGRTAGGPGRLRLVSFRRGKGAHRTPPDLGLVAGHGARRSRGDGPGVAALRRPPRGPEHRRQGARRNSAPSRRQELENGSQSAPGEHRRAVASPRPPSLPQAPPAPPPSRSDAEGNSRGRAGSRKGTSSSICRATVLSSGRERHRACRDSHKPSGTGPGASSRALGGVTGIGRPGPPARPRQLPPTGPTKGPWSGSWPFPLPRKGTICPSWAPCCSRDRSLASPSEAGVGHGPGGQWSWQQSRGTANPR